MRAQKIDIVFIVDDNLIGNKKAVKAFLPILADWLKARDYPFEFTTEASINLADDETLHLLRTLARTAPETRTLVVAGCRDVPADTRPAIVSACSTPPSSLTAWQRLSFKMRPAFSIAR